MRSLRAVQLALVNPPTRAVGAQGRGEAVLDEALPHALHGCHPGAHRLGNPGVAPARPAASPVSRLALVGAQQHLRVLELAHVRLAARQNRRKRVALL